MKIRILLADDHLLLRQGLRRLLESEPDIEVVGEAADGLTVQNLVRETRPDVILMDVNMPMVDGVTAARRILEEAPNCRIIMLTMVQQDESVFEAVRVGAQGYLLKDTPIEDVVRAIHTVHEGKSLIDPSMASRLLIEFRRLSNKVDPTHGVGNLSQKEVDILRLLTTGLTNKEIGNKLFLSEKTIKNHLTMIFQKLQLNDRVQAAIFAVQQGLAPYP